MNSGPPALAALGDFHPADTWQVHVNHIFYGTKGPGIHNHFQTYVSRDHRLAHALADAFHSFCQSLPADDTAPLEVQEWGVGNGNLAARFLSRLRDIDSTGCAYPRLQYTLCDYSLEILKGVEANPHLQDHAGRFATAHLDARDMGGLAPHSLTWVLSNEIWDDLATRVLIKSQGTLYEEYLQPLIDRAVLDGDFETFLNRFENADLEALQAQPPFLEHIVWERAFQRTDLGDWPFGEVVRQHMESIGDDIPVPINAGAFGTLEKAHRLLAPGRSFGYTGFDYGMLDLEHLNWEGRPYFKLYGGQYTSMVNFPLLADVGRAIGFQNVDREPQHTFVHRNLGEPVISLVELVQNHPRVAEMAPWDVDVLMLETLQALNNRYRSPYPNRLDYPTLPGTPKKQRKLMQQLIQNMNARGVPDTVAYITESEVRAADKTLRKLGYREKDIQRSFHPANAAIQFCRLTLR
ncbi:hypothetical protein [Nitrospina watsonii]|uniref:SAM-dependent methyltransferase n=1 Tax=Nitrospina watsonii TaxID=1323948 RepID=A0ABM9HFU3_9BACT|nr:hypothetical protein [Nitrospina watsonii]CAI2719102.1 conserved protein of unknown function [Nitrospina watsonii]